MICKTNRRTVLGGIVLSGGAAAAVLTIGGRYFTATANSKQIVSPKEGEDAILQQKYMAVTDAEWKKKLEPMQYYVLREEGTEKPGSSPLDNEKRAGTFHCIACNNALFTSDKKYDSKTGWPSFYDYLPGSIATKADYKMIIPRTEYHCARCGGHHGHVFKDGPDPTGLRYCNNGVALKFIPA